MPESINLGHDTVIPAVSDATDGTCPAVGYQEVNVSVPITVVPFAYAGAAKVKCCASPVVIPCEDYQGGTKNGKCTFVISQTICVEVPVEFGAKTTVGDTYVDCLNASAYDTCGACDYPETAE